MGQAATNTRVTARRGTSTVVMEERASNGWMIPCAAVRLDTKVRTRSRFHEARAPH